MKNATRKTLAQDDLYQIVTKNTLHIYLASNRFFTMFCDNIICESDYVTMTSYICSSRKCVFFA